MANRVWFAIPQATEWQGIGDQIDAAMIFAGADFRKRARQSYGQIEID